MTFGHVTGWQSVSSSWALSECSAAISWKWSLDCDCATVLCWTILSLLLGSFEVLLAGLAVGGARGCCILLVARADSVRVMNIRFIRFFVSFCICSSRMCIFNSLREVRVSIPRRFRSLVSVLPNTLHSLSQVAELAHMLSIRRASRMKGDGGCPANEKSIYIDNGSGCSP